MIVINELAPGWKWTKLECPLESVTLVMWLLGKFAISCSFTSLFVYASEVFPTVTRNSNIGICAACSRIGATMVPFVKQLVRSPFNNPCLLVEMGILSLESKIKEKESECYF